MTAPSINAPVITVHPRLRVYAIEAARLVLTLLLAVEALAIMIVVLSW